MSAIPQPASSEPLPAPTQTPNLDLSNNSRLLRRFPGNLYRKTVMRCQESESPCGNNLFGLRSHSPKQARNETQDRSNGRAEKRSRIGGFEALVMRVIRENRDQHPGNRRAKEYADEDTKQDADEFGHGLLPQMPDHALKPKQSKSFRRL
jgi:hypothetical protein